MKILDSNQELNSYFKSLLSKTTLENIESKIRKKIVQERPKTTVRIKAHRTATTTYQTKKNVVEEKEQKTHRDWESPTSKIEKAYLGTRSRRIQADTACTEHSFAMSTINKIREVSHLLSWFYYFRVKNMQNFSPFRSGPRSHLKKYLTAQYGQAAASGSKMQQATMQLLRVPCPYHMDDRITNFCKSYQCLLPMCPKCVKAHT